MIGECDNFPNNEREKISMFFEKVEETEMFFALR